MKLSKEHREKISNALKGKPTWNKGKNLGGKIEIVCENCGNKKTIRKRKRNQAKYCSHKCYGIAKKGSSNLKTRGKQHHFWKGDNAKYSSIHDWVRAKKGNANEYKCIHCDKKARDWANVDHLYSRNLKDYIPLCRGCHIKYDRYNLKINIYEQNSHWASNK